MKVIIIGGGSAGTTCAFELRKQNKDVEILILEGGEHTEYSPCALPYVVEGVIESFDDIFIFSAEEYQHNNIDLRLGAHVRSIDRERKLVVYEQGGQEHNEQYDHLVIATGARARIPRIDGLQDVSWSAFKTLEDAKSILAHTQKGQRSLVVGSGLVGVELAYALACRGEEVFLVESQDQILGGFLDAHMTNRIISLLEESKVQVFTGLSVQKCHEDKVVLHGTDTEKVLSVDRVLLCTGVVPDTELALNCGLEVRTGILVDEHMRTSDKNIFSCGDLVVSKDFVSGSAVISQLGTSAVRQGQVVAKNILGEQVVFGPVLNTTITKIGSLFVGGVGLTEQQATKQGIRVMSAKHTSGVRSQYYPSDHTVSVKIICDDQERIIGGQIIGEEEVVGRINMLALAMSKGVLVHELANLETCYNPASNPIFDPVAMTAKILAKKLAVMKEQ